jgi:hypothetical protein
MAQNGPAKREDPLDNLGPEPRIREAFGVDELTGGPFETENAMRQLEFFWERDNLAGHSRQSQGKK